MHRELSARLPEAGDGPPGSDPTPATDRAAEIERLRLQRQELAKQAWHHGEAALTAGQLETAGRWFDRARRLAPGNPNPELAVAALWLRLGRSEACALFEALASRHDMRAVWLGLAAARRSKGDAPGAAAALIHALSRHAAAVDAAFRSLADDIAAADHAPGWCAAGEDGTLFIGPLAVLARGSAPVLMLDGRQNRVRMPSSGRLKLPGMARADRLDAAIGGRALLGSPIDLAALRRTEGCVAAGDGGIAGWAWLPANPDIDPVLRIRPASGGPGFTIRAADATMETWSEQPLVRPRRFTVPASRIAGWRAPVHVLGADGRDILGSPLDPRIVAPGRLVGAPNARPRRAPPARRARPGTTVVVPVYRGCDATLQCLETVRATVARRTRIVVVDDASPEPRLAGALDALARRGRIELIRHARNRGFPASANAGMRAAGDGDVVLLNSDTLVAEGWLERLRAVTYAAADIGTVTPLSNDAGIVNYPALAGGNPVPDRAATERFAALAHRANAGRWIEIPTAVGFCMYIRRACLEAVGRFREDPFAQGYGEENDFCMRARRLGWRHVAAAGVFVAHVGAQSFGAARAHLMARNLAVLNRMYPGYDALIAAHNAADPLAGARRRIDAVRWRADRRAKAGAVLLVTHDRGGGVQRQVEARIAALRAAGRRPIVLRPVLPECGTDYAGLCQVDGGFADAYPNLCFALPGEFQSLARLLRGDRVEYAEVHHLLGHDHGVLDLCGALGVPYEVHVHDYAWFCPRISLLGPDRRYCGEPDVAHCEACVGEAGRSIEEDISVAALRRRSAADLAGARRVIAPSVDTARRIGRHFPRVAPLVVPWEEPVAPPSAPGLPNGERRICVIGAIGPEKGYDVLLAAARDAARRDLPLQFIVVGHTVDDAELLRTGRVFVTGEYRDAEATALIRAQRADIAWLPSLWPETWCFALSEAWRAGLDVVAFDIGALAERIRNRGRGILLPLGLPPGALNDVLLVAHSGALAGAGGNAPSAANA
jgi:GT2 family glycosyltransferase/glycosyltransferase involved in cell wall biosynthesis